MEKYKRFSNYYHDWSSKHLSDNTTDPLKHLWLKTHRSTSTNSEQTDEILPILSTDSNDLTRPPYRHYRQYNIVDT